jgi:hypothetical protein
MVERKAGKTETGKPERQSTQPEHAVAEQVRRRQSITPAPHDGAKSSAKLPDHPNETDDFGPLMKALGTTDPDFAKGLFGQLVGASARRADKFDGEALFFALAAIKRAKPRDELEAMQVAQMAAVHTAMMRITGELARAENLQHQDSATRALNQLARTFTAQLEALKRYRSGAEQKVTVQNVSVTEGGRAIVGNVTQATPGTAAEERANATPALTDARQPAMEIIGQSERVAVPLRAKSRRLDSDH